MIRIGHDHLQTQLGDSIEDALIIGGHYDLSRIGFDGPLANMGDHRLSCNVQ